MQKHRKIIMVAIYVFMVLVQFHFAFEWYGFGVDSYGRVYVGDRNAINVLDENQHVHTIEVPPHRGYYFTVQTDDTILIATEARVYVADYFGNILSSEYESGDTTYTKLMHLQNVETVNGDIYRCRSFLGRRFIEDENGNVVYEVPFSSYMASIVNTLPFVLIATVIFLSEWEKEGKRQKQ